MKYTVSILLAIGLFSCVVTKQSPIMGQYSNDPKIFKSEKTTDQVWDNLIDLFAQNGLSIKIIDRSSGLIVSEKTQLLSSIEVVDPKTKQVSLKNPKAYVVTSRIKSPSDSKYYGPSKVFGEWNVRIKPDTNNGTLINVNLVNITTEPSIPTTTVYDTRSTGVFEKMIFDIIK